MTQYGLIIFITLIHASILVILTVKKWLQVPDRELYSVKYTFNSEGMNFYLRWIFFTAVVSYTFGTLIGGNSMAGLLTALLNVGFAAISGVHLLLLRIDQHNDRIHK